MATLLRSGMPDSALRSRANSGLRRIWRCICFLGRGSVTLHLSEHTGEARPNTLVYLYVKDADQTAHLTGDDGSGNMVYSQEVHVTLYCSDHAILLPSEY